MVTKLIIVKFSIITFVCLSSMSCYAQKRYSIENIISSENPLNYNSWRWRKHLDLEDLKKKKHNFSYNDLVSCYNQISSPLFIQKRTYKNLSIKNLFDLYTRGISSVNDKSIYFEIGKFYNKDEIDSSLIAPRDSIDLKKMESDYAEFLLSNNILTELGNIHNKEFDKIIKIIQDFHNGFMDAYLRVKYDDYSFKQDIKINIDSNTKYLLAISNFDERKITISSKLISALFLIKRLAIEVYNNHPHSIKKSGDKIDMIVSMDPKGDTLDEMLKILSQELWAIVGHEFGHILFSKQKVKDNLEFLCDQYSMYCFGKTWYWNGGSGNLDSYGPYLFLLLKGESKNYKELWGFTYNDELRKRKCYLNKLIDNYYGLIGNNEEALKSCLR